MVPATETEDGDIYDEYMVINGAVERVGDWKVDLSDYAKTADVNGALALKADQTAVDGALALKADTSYVDAEIDKVEEVVAEKADTSALTSAVEAIEAELALKAAQSVVDQHGKDILALQQGLAAAATKEELQSLTDIVNTKADQSALEALDKELGEAPVYETQTNEETGEEEKVLVTPGTGVYSIVYTKEETADLIAQITGGESAADVLAALNTYKGTNDAAVKALQDKDAAIDAQIAALQQQADQAINILEGVEINGEALDIVEKHVNIPVAGALLGVVKSSEAENAVKVAEDGTMSVNSLNVNKLTQTEGEKLILYGGSSDK